MADKGKAKFVIKPFRPYCQMDQQQAEEIWQQLRAAITQIHNHNASSLSFEELYRNAYNLVLHKHGDLLYRGVCDCVRQHLLSVAADVAATADECLLERLSTAWGEHQQTMMMVRDILMYLDRTYVQQQRKVAIYDHGLLIFRDTIARHPLVKDRLRHLLLAAVASERGGQLVEWVLLKNTLAMLADLGVDGLGVYEDDFEAPFLDETTDFYRHEALSFLAANTCPDYLAKAEARLAEEHLRARLCLHPSTEPKLKRIVEAELVTRHARAVVEMDSSGCVAMLRAGRVHDLAKMYQLLTRVPATLEILRRCVCDFVKKLGTELVLDQAKVKDPVLFVKQLLAMRDEYDGIVEVAFGGEKKAAKALKDAFEGFINADTQCASFLVLYVDELLKSGLKGLTEAEVDAQLEKVLVIFRYLQDKDVFENFYKQYLSKRLLGGKSMSEDSERSMIAKLKRECGYHFTSKLEGMFTDMAMSKETMEQFHAATSVENAALAAEAQAAAPASGGASSLSAAAARPAAGPAPKVELEVQVLTAAHWPANRWPPCSLPPQVANAHAAFCAFYQTKHTGRKLAWHTALGHADLKARFSNTARHDLHVSTYQMVILMQFNGCDTRSLEALSELGIPPNELRRHLVSLCTPKHKILKKASKGKGVDAGDSFSFNPEYTSKLKRVKVPLVSAKEPGLGGGGGLGGGDGVPAGVEEDRRHLVEAAVVRIMKTRKVLSHNELVAEVARQLSHRFCAAPAFIKKRVESLLEREYLARDAEDRRVYTYLA